MISITAISRTNTNLSITFLSNVNSTLEKYFRAAQDIRNLLGSSFVAATTKVQDIIPPFRAAASFVTEKMDIISIKGKAGQAPFVPGHRDDAYNGIRRLMRQVWAETRRTQSNTYSMAPI